VTAFVLRSHKVRDIYLAIKQLNTGGGEFKNTLLTQDSISQDN